MRPDDLYEFTRRQPFRPFRVHASDGEAYEVRHPDQAIVLRRRIVIGVGGDNGVSEHVIHLALIHIVRIEELESSGSASN